MTRTYDLEATWRALASPTRRRIVELLKQRPWTTAELCAALQPQGRSRFAVMQHLRVLEAAGVVAVSRRGGRTQSNLLNPLPIQQLDGWIRQFRGLTPPPLLRFLDPAQYRRELRLRHRQRPRGRRVPRGPGGHAP